MRVLNIETMEKKRSGRAELVGPQGSGGESKGPWDVSSIFQK